MNIPEGYDVNEIQSWITEEDEILETFENEGNFIVYSKYTSEEDYVEDEYAVTRFFISKR